MNIRTMTLLSALALPGLFACKKDNADTTSARNEPGVTATETDKDLAKANKDLAKEDKKIDERTAETTGALGAATLRSTGNANLTGHAELTGSDSAPQLSVNLTNASPGAYSVGLMKDCPKGADFDAKDMKQVGSINVTASGTGQFTGALSKDMTGEDHAKDLDDEAVVVFRSSAVGDTTTDTHAARTADKKDTVSTTSVIACGELEVSDRADDQRGS